MRAPEFWHTRPGLASGLLAPFGTAWDAAARLHRALVRPYHASTMVVCVGNLVAGGAGKTPVVLSLAERIAGSGCVVHAVTRGYGGHLGGPLRVDPALHDAAAVGDEALLLAARVPCWVARDRAAGVRAATADGAEIVLLDDGFQNPRVHKDQSLVVVDADYGFGNCRVMPAGPLREAAASGLERADAIVLLGGAAVPTLVRRSGRPILRAMLEAVDGERFAGARVVAFAGIGRPEKFFASLRASGAVLVATHPFADHFRFAPRDIARLRREAESAGARLVTTAKDRVRLPPPDHGGIEVFEVRVRWRDPGAAARFVAHILTLATEKHDRSAAHG
jgi:tetraacyldisaccharide 4'-kinase